MGFMGGLFKALGFEGETKATKKVKAKTNNATYMLKSDKALRPNQIDGVPVYYPETFEQAVEFIDFVKNNKAIIISQEFCDKEISRRIYDYMQGFSNGSKSKLITLNEDKLYLLLPEGMEVEE